jgi:hypothetical protein
MLTFVFLLPDKATSKPVLSPGELWKQVIIFPPKPKLNTGALADARPRGSFEPKSVGDGAYAECVGALRYCAVSCVGSS